MARSHAIWVVLDVVYSSVGKVIPAAAFTVKHELVAWLRQNEARQGAFRIYWCLDNPPSAPSYVREVSVEAILRDAKKQEAKQRSFGGKAA